MLQIRQFTLGPLQTNCYLLGCETTMECAIIDPAWDGNSVATVAQDDGWRITHILLTHCHFDHVGGLDEVKSATSAPIYVHADAVKMLGEASMSAALFGLRIAALPAPDQMLIPGQTLQVGELDLKVLYTPGHAPGHVCFHLPEYRVVFDGDVLFQGSIGRTDLGGGDFDVLMRSIWDSLMPLPDETRLFPGHGPATSVGDERRHNPFLQEGFKP